MLMDKSTSGNSTQLRQEAVAKTAIKILFRDSMVSAGIESSNELWVT